VVCAQNHDQIGNRALGDRLTATVDDARARVAAALYLLSPFTPLVFQGEEWAATTPFQYFTDHDGDLGRAVTEGRRREFAAFGWDPSRVPDPQDPATFERSRLDWAEPAGGRHAEMLGWYRRCIALRRENPAFSHHHLGSVHAVADERARTIVLFRGAVTVAANLGEMAVDVVLADRPSQVLLASVDGIVEPANGTLHLPAAAVVVLGP
jgi:maltooligosyltrehalose trehalohydrolase